MGGLIPIEEEQLVRVLTTDRLSLRPAAASDQEDLLRLWTDPDVRRYLWDNRIIDLDTVEAICAASATLFAQRGIGLFVLEHLVKPGQLVGFCGLRKMQVADGGMPGSLSAADNIELLYGMFPKFWGSGIVTEAAREVLRYGFEECDLHSVVAATDTPNQRSVRVMQRLGMVFETRCEWHGLDTVFYVMRRDDYLDAL